jgi:putative glycosyltransferase (TIGR04348 family)
MKIQIVSPAPAGSQAGNNVTAARWAGLLEQLGHSVSLARELEDTSDLLVALHARRSFPVIERARWDRPERPVFVALTGTDLYQDLPGSAEARQSLEWATRLLVLQPLAREALPEPLRRKTRVIVQSAEAPENPPAPDPDVFEVCVMGHLRAVKDPFRTAAASRRLPPASRVRVTQVGAALAPEFAEQARSEERENPRYRWLGELPQAEALGVLARSRLLALTSRSEGGANVISEALACGTPVVSSHIPGSVGLLGAGYPGYFPAGDTAALAVLLHRAETEAAFYAHLRDACAVLASMVHPDRERDAWAALLREV